LTWLLGDQARPSKSDIAQSLTFITEINSDQACARASPNCGLSVDYNDKLHMQMKMTTIDSAATRF